MIDEMNEKYRTETGVDFAAGAGGLPVCIITTPSASAHIYLHGAHVAAFNPTGEKPLMYMSPRSKFAALTPIRGGVPICFPWFGPREGEPTAPAHGFARLLSWKCVDISRHGDAITVSLQLDPDQQTKKYWPYDFRATYRVTVASQMRMELEITNRSGEPFEFSEALHTYISVSDVSKINITGLERVSFNDKAAGAMQQATGKEIRFEGETDRVYLDTTDTCVIHDSGFNRKIEVAKSGSKSTVVWNPHVKKAALMTDLGEDTWPNFVCVETANALSNKLTLLPGATQVMSQSIRVLKG